jgi:dCMP deaminase
MEEQKKERPSFLDIYMELAHKMSERSTCARKNSAGAAMRVGCVISSPDFRKIVAVGYNGGASGDKNDCDRHGAEAVGNCGCLHAEENAAINCDVPRATPKIVFCTHLPCVMCAKRLINLGGVVKVYYDIDYRDRSALVLFTRASIEWEQFTPGSRRYKVTPCQHCGLPGGH